MGTETGCRRGQPCGSQQDISQRTQTPRRRTPLSELRRGQSPHTSERLQYPLHGADPTDPLASHR